MKKHTIIGMLAAIVLLAACEEQPDISILKPGEMILTARVESPTKTVVTDDLSVFWEPGDEIAVFSGEKRARFASVLDAPAATAVFRGSFDDNSSPNDLWALYPYSDDASFDGERITATIPSTQTARAGSFAPGMNLSVAHALGPDLQFYNVGGGLRFSVTEDGIKKVIFEGLGGEILAGKVSIAFENGLPKVTGITGGSQFITLLPPEGETFQKDAWYYITAIPDTLESGYKLRFYRDEDYARRVSENTVTIKRSIYGSIASADAGQVYESIVTKFPETDGDWEKSVAMTEQISEDVNTILFSNESLVIQASDDLIAEIKNVEGVAAVRACSSGSGIAVQQNDGIVINYLLNIDSSADKESTDVIPPSVVSFETKSQSHICSSTYSSETEYFLNAKKKAIILSPFSHYFGNSPSADVICQSLVLSGYERDNIEIYKDHNASMSFFRGETLSNYDFVCIISHGGTAFCSTNTDTGKLDKEEEASILVTYVPYEAERAVQLFSFFSPDELAVVSLDDDRDGENELYFAVTPDILHDASFNDACIVLFACSSTFYSTKNDPRSMVWRFLDQGARIVSGSNRTISGKTDPECFERLLKLCVNGISVQDAVNHYKKSQSVKYFCDEKFFWHHDRWPGTYPMEDKQFFEFYNLWEYYENPSYTGIPYFLIEPFPKLKNAAVSNNSVIFVWDSPLSSFSIPWQYDPYDSFTDYYTVCHDLYVDTDKVASGLQDLEYYWNQAAQGPHDWYVVSTISLNNEVIASYKSEVGHFTVEGGTPGPKHDYPVPEIVDLGLPSGIKWASFNVGASAPEEYGEYFAWGETEPKTYFGFETYKWCNGTITSLTKYNTLSEYGIVDSKTVLELEDDVAHVKLGGNWRMPTDAEMTELREKCTWNRTTLGGKSGYEVTSKTNGNSIFLPDAGYRNDNSIYGGSYNGNYWSSSFDAGYPYSAWRLGFNSSGEIFRDDFYRSLGLTVRAVYDDGQPSVPGSGTLATRTYGGKTYSIARDSVFTYDCRTNGDGSPFYACSYTIEYGGRAFTTPTLYTYADDRDWKDMGPAIAVDSSTGTVYVFAMEKSSGGGYGMDGYLYTISGGNVSSQQLFSGYNYGWFPYFQKTDNQLELHFFSFAGYFGIVALQNNEWTLQDTGSIYPADFKALQQAAGLICCY